MNIQQEIQDAFESMGHHMETSKSEFRNSSGPAPPPPDWVQWPPPSLGERGKITDHCWVTPNLEEVVHIYIYIVTNLKLNEIKYT